MIRAINKYGREAFFSQRVWDLMPKHRNGWVEWTEQGAILVPDKVVEFQTKKKNAEDVMESEPTPNIIDVMIPSHDEVKEFQPKITIPKVVKPRTVKKVAK